MRIRGRGRARRRQPSEQPGKREKAPAVNGIIRPDTGALRVPSDLTDEDKSASILPNNVVLVIALLALLFIAIITWFVAHMPAK